MALQTIDSSIYDLMSSYYIKETKMNKNLKLKKHCTFWLTYPKVCEGKIWT